MRRNAFKVQINGEAVVEVDGQDLSSMQGELDVKRVDGLELTDEDADYILSRLGETIAEIGKEEPLQDESQHIPDEVDGAEFDFDDMLEEMFSGLEIEEGAEQKIADIVDSEDTQRKLNASDSIKYLEGPMSGHANEIMTKLEVIDEYLSNLDRSMHVSVPEEVPVAIADIVIACFEIEGQ